MQKLQENPLKYKVYVFGSIADRHTDKTMYRIGGNISKKIIAKNFSFLSIIAANKITFIP